MPTFLLTFLLLASPGPAEDAARKDLVLGVYTSIGNMGLSFTNLGFFGNLLNQSANYPSCEYPLNSNVEHVYMGGIWVGGISAEGDTLVSAGADDTPSGESSPAQEFGPRLADGLIQISSNVLSPRFDPAAFADQDFQFAFDDLSGAGGGGNAAEPHRPLGLRVHNRVLAYAPSYADDFVILDFEVENISESEIEDVYLGFYTEFSVGNTTVTIPGDQTSPWNFYDDFNGYLDEQDGVENDPDIKMMYSYDDDGEDGKAPTWVGLRMLGHDAPDEPTISYRQWPFRQSAWPQEDQLKYEYMASGLVDEGRRGELDFDLKRNWSNMLSVGPWPLLAPGERVRLTLAYVAGADSTDLITNSQVAQATFDSGFRLPTGPPSPELQVTAGNNRVELRWNAGRAPTPADTLQCEEAFPDDETAAQRCLLRIAQPEFHRSSLTQDYDFQGYRVYRIRADAISGDPFEQASLIAEFDRTEWPDGTPDRVGFNTGLPPREGGERVFVDDNVLNGFRYWYSVTSYAARDPRLELPELESGFNENSVAVVPGNVPGDGPDRLPVSVYPNPYRAASLFDTRRPGGEPSELGRNIYFTNVPTNSTIEIFNLSGALIDRLEGSGQVAWDMLSSNTRALSPGLYVWAVSAPDGDVQRGKLVILK